MQDIIHKSATIIGTEKGWVLPGGRVVRNEQQAKMCAIRINRIMERSQ